MSENFQTIRKFPTFISRLFHILEQYSIKYDHNKKSSYHESEEIAHDVNLKNVFMLSDSENQKNHRNHSVKENKCSNTASISKDTKKCKFIDSNLEQPTIKSEKYTKNDYSVISSNNTYDDLITPITWSPHGTTFTILSISLFSERILPEYFNTHLFSSFIRQLNMYGFRRVKTNTKKQLNSQSNRKKNTNLTFFHQFFIQNKPYLFYKIIRIKKKSTFQLTEIIRKMKEMERRITSIVSKMNKIERVISYKTVTVIGYDIEIDNIRIFRTLDGIECSELVIIKEENIIYDEMVYYSDCNDDEIDEYLKSDYSEKEYNERNENDYNSIIDRHNIIDTYDNVISSPSKIEKYHYNKFNTVNSSFLLNHIRRNTFIVIIEKMKITKKSISIKMA